MRIINKKSILFMISLAVFVSGLFLYLDRILVYSICRTHGLDISYKNQFPPARYKYYGLHIEDRKRGFGILAKEADIKPTIDFKNIGEGTIRFDLKDMRFLEKGKSGALYDSLSALAASPFTGSWAYSQISGKLRIHEGTIYVDDFNAAGDDIKFSIKGAIYKDNAVKLEIVIYFSKEVASKIPEALSSVVLQEGQDGFKSLSISLSGNYRTPSIAVASKLFRLNIGEETAREIAF